MGQAGKKRKPPPSRKPPRSTKPPPSGKQPPSGRDKQADERTTERTDK